MGFGLVTGFVNHLQVVTTNNYYTIADLHNLQSLHTDLLILFLLIFAIHFLATGNRKCESLTKLHTPNIDVLQQM
jgi:hypothetical protein